MNNEIKEYCKYCRFYGVLGCKSTLICNDGNRFFNPNIANEEQGITLVYDDESGTWGEALEVYGTIECATKEDYEYAKKAIKGYKELEAKHWDECRQIAHYDDELKEAKRLMKAVKWISVKDRLPEDDGKYMVWYKGELDICEFDVESQTFGYTYDDYDEMYSHLVCWDDGMDKDITHWMPLPEPPKDGDTNG